MRRATPVLQNALVRRWARCMRCDDSPVTAIESSDERAGVGLG